MKTAKALATITLVATVILVPMSSAWAHHGGHHSHHSGAAWGAAVGGTTLGFLMGSAAAQAARPAQPAQPQVVILQPPPRPGVDDAAYVRSAEMMRLKQQNYMLELELERLKVKQAQDDAIVNNASE
jgi:hypothetical protein